MNVKPKMKRSVFKEIMTGVKELQAVRKRGLKLKTTVIKLKAAKK